MKQFLFALFALSILATDANAEPATEQKSAASDDYDYDRRVQDLYAWLNLPGLKDEPEYDQITFFYHWFMDAMIGVTIINRPGLTDKDGVTLQNASLNASVIVFTDRYSERDGDLYHDRIVTDTYQTKISDKDFNAVAAYLDQRSFWSDPIDMPYDTGPDEEGFIMICEGPYFVIEARITGRSHLITRGGCGEDVAAELDHATKLLELAKVKIPPIRKLLKKAEGHLRGG